ncbi:hypothetical protein [Haloarchaeobius sp. TZWWS8]|uniref:hypothetical protein n=1 Tax=Haloarchaeobius sp. TZWWS8 TaxID=3446121 RepID=UPI003EBCAAC0
MEEINPFAELEDIDRRCRKAEEDDIKRCWCPDTHPKPPSSKQEGVTSLDGNRLVDLMGDTPAIEDELGLSDPVNGGTENSILGIDLDSKNGSSGVLDF